MVTMVTVRRSVVWSPASFLRKEGACGSSGGSGVAADTHEIAKGCMTGSSSSSWSSTQCQPPPPFCRKSLWVAMRRWAQDSSGSRARQHEAAAAAAASTGVVVGSLCLPHTLTKYLWVTRVDLANPSISLGGQWLLQTHTQCRAV